MTAKYGTLIWGLEETIKNRWGRHPEMVIADPEVLQRAINEIERLRGVTDLGDGELIGLYRPNKE